MTEGTIASPGIGASQRALLEALKRRGESTLAELEGTLQLASETLRSPLQALTGPFPPAWRASAYSAFDRRPWRPR